MRNYLYVVTVNGKNIPAVIYTQEKGFTAVAGYNLLRLQGFVKGLNLPEGIFVETSKDYINYINGRLQEVQMEGMLVTNIVDLDKMLDSDKIDDDLQIGINNAERVLGLDDNDDDCDDYDDYDDDYDEDEDEEECDGCLDDCEQCPHSTPSKEEIDDAVKAIEHLINNELRGLFK